MKLYCYYTSSCDILAKEWLIASLKDDYEIILERGIDKGYISYKKEGWENYMSKKAQLIIKAIVDNQNEVFIYADSDIQFFKKTKNKILKLLKGKDLLFQRNSPQGELCAGFFVCRGNKRTLRLWKKIDSRIFNKHDDQDILNHILLPKHSFWKVLSKFFIRKVHTQCSQRGLNSYGIRWGYLPETFFGGGTLTGKIWNPGIELDISKDIIMHHANFTVGINKKIAQLEYVKNIVNSRKQNIKEGVDSNQ